MSPGGKGPSWKGTPETLAEVLRPFVTTPTWLPSKDATAEATLVKQRELWKGLHDLQANWSIATTVIYAALMILAEPFRETWTPILGTNHETGAPLTLEEWARGVQKRMTSILLVLGKAYRRKPVPAWVQKIINVDANKQRRK